MGLLSTSIDPFTWGFVGKVHEKFDWFMLRCRWCINSFAVMVYFDSNDAGPSLQSSESQDFLINFVKKNSPKT